jgi:plastocyanin
MEGTDVIRRLLALIAVLALALTACGDDDSTDTDTTGAGGDANIVIEGFAFNAPASVDVGTTVTVQNRDGVAHTWTAADGTFDSGNIAGGGSFQFTFDAAGEYAFACQIHPDMQGSITVNG